MIRKLNRKFILISAASIFAVILLIFLVIGLLNLSSMNRSLDTLTDTLSRGGGRFPDSFEEFFRDAIGFDPFPVGPETRYSTRHYTVWFSAEGEPVYADTEYIYAVDQDQAIVYGQKALSQNRQRGWISHYRYKCYPALTGTAVVFVDASTNLSSLYQSLGIALTVLVASALIILLLIVIFSKRVMKPIADSYEKQKQFITDAGHELKTPLTLILTNLDIAQQELGDNEWLDDIRTEGQRMTALVNQLVALSRMDEETPSEKAAVAFGELVSDTVSEFVPLLTQQGKKLHTVIDSSVTCTGDEMLLRRLVSILMDNAAKYCDGNGTVTVTVQRQRHLVLQVENTYRAVAQLELDRLFDRFYRADKARTYTGSFGIGLSMAKSITEKHLGQITAYQKDSQTIGFQVVLK